MMAGTILIIFILLVVFGVVLLVKSRLLVRLKWIVLSLFFAVLFGYVAFIAMRLH